MKNAYLVVLSAMAFVGATACGSKGDGGSSAPSPYIAGFNPPAVEAGYTRYITPVIQDIGPGTSNIWCQWLTAPGDADQDVLAVTGEQSQYGHHAVLYATTEIEPVGTSRLCTNADMLSVDFLGGIGGEGATSVNKDLPPNFAFRLPKGQALLGNIHFLNVGTETIEGQAVLDVQYAPPDPSRQIAGLFANNGDAFVIPPHATDYTYDVTCPIAQEMSFFLFANHMHQYGVSAFTELLHSDGTTQMIVQNTSWSPDYEFNPDWVSFPVSNMLVMKVGDSIHTHCEWTGAAATSTVFPTEMCVGVGFNTTSGPQLSCTDNTWDTP